jgi:hypothetical protein
MLGRIDLDRMAVKKIERALAQSEPSNAALSSLQQEILDEAEQPLLLIAARALRGKDDAILQAAQAGERDALGYVSVLVGRASQSEFIESLRIRGRVKSIRASLLKYHSRFVEIAKLPVEEQVGRIKELAADPTFPQLASRMREMLLFHCNHAELRCAAVMLAVERYRRAKDHWPNALVELVPGYLPNVPLDPFNGAPLRYRRLDDGVVIYSIGPDGKDNGAKLEHEPKRSDAWKEGTDLGVRLWDVQKRRQAPNPAQETPKQVAD